MHRSCWPLVLLALFIPATLAAQTTFTVDSAADDGDAVIGDGVCATALNACTLRAAIQEANALAGNDTIVLPAGAYTLTIAGGNENAAATGDLDVSSTIVIAGAGAQTTIIDGGALDRVFDVLAGGSLSLRDLTVRNGATGVGEDGGGIRNAGTLTLDRVRVVDNTSDVTAAGIFSGGAGASLTIAGSTISNNTAAPVATGAIFVGSSVATISNTTISGNTSVNGVGAIRADGATTTVSLSAVTVANNVGLIGSMMVQNGASIRMLNSLIVSAPGLSCQSNVGSFVHNGGSVAGGGDCGTVMENPDAAALLNPLALNAPGATETHSLAPGHPAIGAGVTAQCLAADQRGTSRAGAPCDSGAFQLSVATAPPPTTPAPPTGHPTITAIADQVIPQNGTTGPLPFTVSGRIIASALRVTAVSSDRDLVPPDGIVLAGSGAQRSIAVTPGDGRSGTTTITVTVDDGALTESRRFDVTVVSTLPADAPTNLAAARSGNAVVLTWTPPRGAMPLYYAVAGEKQALTPLPPQLVAGTETRIVLEGLGPGTYHFRVHAVGMAATGPASNDVTVAIGVEAPQAPFLPALIHNVVPAADGTRAFLAAWFNIDAQEYGETGSSPTTFNGPLLTNFRFIRESRILPPGGPDGYWFRVRTFNAGGGGYPSQPVFVPADRAALPPCDGPPSAPVLLPVMGLGSQAVVSWLPGGSAARHRIEVVTFTQALIATFNRESGASVTRIVLDNASPGPVQVFVTAINACGVSGPRSFPVTWEVGKRP
jgi:CSLREA domain-containing protein